jgi:hypothetical protein
MFVASQISKDAKKQNKTEQILCDFLNEKLFNREHTKPLRMVNFDNPL